MSCEAKGEDCEVFIWLLSPFARCQKSSESDADQTAVAIHLPLGPTSTLAVVKQQHCSCRLAMPTPSQKPIKCNQCDERSAKSASSMLLITYDSVESA